MNNQSDTSGNIMSNPIGWGAGVVGTKIRFGLSLIILPAFMLLIISNITEKGIGEYWSDALLLVAIPLMLLYSMRKMYKQFLFLKAQSK